MSGGTISRAVKNVHDTGRVVNGARVYEQNRDDEAVDEQLVDGEKLAELVELEQGLGIGVPVECESDSNSESESEPPLAMALVGQQQPARSQSFSPRIVEEDLDTTTPPNSSETRQRQRRALCRILYKRGWSKSDISKKAKIPPATIFDAIRNVLRTRAGNQSPRDDEALDEQVVDDEILQRMLGLESSIDKLNTTSQASSSRPKLSPPGRRMDQSNTVTTGRPRLAKFPKLELAERALCRILRDEHHWKLNEIAYALGRPRLGGRSPIFNAVHNRPRRENGQEVTDDPSKDYDYVDRGALALNTHLREQPTLNSMDFIADYHSDADTEDPGIAADSDHIRWSSFSTSATTLHQDSPGPPVNLELEKSCGADVTAAEAIKYNCYGLLGCNFSHAPAEPSQNRRSEISDSPSPQSGAEGNFNHQVDGELNAIARTPSETKPTSIERTNWNSKYPKLTRPERALCRILRQEYNWVYNDLASALGRSRPGGHSPICKAVRNVPRRENGQWVTDDVSKDHDVVDKVLLNKLVGGPNGKRDRPPRIRQPKESHEPEVVSGGPSRNGHGKLPTQKNVESKYKSTRNMPTKKGHAPRTSTTATPSSGTESSLRRFLLRAGVSRKHEALLSNRGIESTGDLKKMRRWPKDEVQDQLKDWFGDDLTDYEVALLRHAICAL
ncbi:hypothetical protein HMN09_00822200 [Mycena chlorophos]|uniref:Uncharacterized protein n=1 Tax=Mycena chlorophos TaxID=658473 RepID=A0A8H6SWL8_MYCCL|nr:hypothetical protein HMN09_00822200 [Mycena chlorophos]